MNFHTIKPRVFLKQSWQTRRYITSTMIRLTLEQQKSDSSVNAGFLFRYGVLAAPDRIAAGLILRAYCGGITPQEKRLGRAGGNHRSGSSCAGEDAHSGSFPALIARPFLEQLSDDCKTPGYLSWKSCASRINRSRFLFPILPTRPPAQ